MKKSAQPYPGIHLYSAEEIRSIRKKQGLNQTVFWARFLVTQTTGCRYESGQDIPTTTQILLNIALGSAAAAGSIVEGLRAQPEVPQTLSSPRGKAQRSTSFQDLPFGILP